MCCCASLCTDAWLLCAGMGYVGAALASSISTWLQFLLLVVYIRFFKVARSACPRIFARLIKPVEIPPLYCHLQALYNTSGVRVCMTPVGLGSVLQTLQAKTMNAE
jgi:hypothetical protein